MCHFYVPILHCPLPIAHCYIVHCPLLHCPFYTSFSWSRRREALLRFPTTWLCFFWHLQFTSLNFLWSTITDENWPSDQPHEVSIPGGLPLLGDETGVGARAGGWPTSSPPPRPAAPNSTLRRSSASGCTRGLPGWAVSSSIFLVCLLNLRTQLPASLSPKENFNKLSLFFQVFNFRFSILIDCYIPSVCVGGGSISKEGAFREPS